MIPEPKPHRTGFTPPKQAIPAEMPAFLAAIWSKNLPLMRERLAILDSALHALEQHEFNAETREQAIDVAHKFAGSLGTFGFPQGTEAARQLEHLLLLSTAESSPPDTAIVCLLVESLHHILEL